MSHFHPLTVKHIKKLTPTSVAVTFSIPKELAQTFSFTAGQYITIKKEIKIEDSDKLAELAGVEF